MAGVTQTTRFRFWLWLIRVVGVIVPRRLRSDWRQEWEAELRYRERLLAEWDRLDWRSKVDLLRRSQSAFWDALSLQPQRLEDEMFQDLHFALRSLRNHMLLSVVVVATLTLGIGFSAGVFAYYNAELLRARVDRDHGSFARIYSAYTEDPSRPGRLDETTLEDYLTFRDGAKSLGNLAAYARFDAPLDKDDPREARTLLTTCNFFSLYDPGKPLLGRLLQPEDCAAANPVVVLSERLWRYRFAADPQIVGKVTHFNGQPVTVVGVTPNFAGMVNGARAWFPYTLETYLKGGDNLLRPGEAAWLNVAGRLNPGFSRQDATAELRLLASQKDRLHPGRLTTVVVTDGSQIQAPGESAAMLVFAVLLGMLFFLVLIVCVNVTTLLLARASARRQEIAVRLALGAGKIRLIRTLLTETFLLASLAGLLSLYLTWRIPGILNRWLTNQSEGGGVDYSLAPDWRVFGYLTMVTVFAGTMAGLAPALQSLKVNLSEMLKGRQIAPGGGRGSRLYGLLIGAQVALSFFLLCGAVFCVSAYQKAVAFEPGFETRRVLWTGLFVKSSGAQERNWDAFHRTLKERLEALPGAQSVAHSNRPPFMYAWTTRVQAPGQAMRQVAINWVSPNYFSTLGIPIVSGRAIRESDPPCENSGGKFGCSVVVSQQLAREVWPGENPLGQTLQSPEGNSFLVVGVVRDVSSTRLGGLDDPMIYQPLNLNGIIPPHPLVRFSGDGPALARAITTISREMAPELTIEAKTIESMREGLMESLERQTRLFVFLGALAVILVVIGIYGVVAFAVSQRAKEMGIRIALGAQTKDIYRAVLIANVRPVAVGLLIGLALTVAAFSALAPLIRDELNMNPLDPITYAITIVLLAAAALGAMLNPSRRATKVDPLTALRH
ncbi:MAG TPA: ADOP family duplicated permease [Blastocatellia bacterium]|nr:ADOP family duplicated permease [Blastocatellia bacterium]